MPHTAPSPIATPPRTVVSTGPDAGTYLTGTAVGDHATTHVAGTGAQEFLALITLSADSGIVYLAPLTGDAQNDGFELTISIAARPSMAMVEPPSGTVKAFAENVGPGVDAARPSGNRT